MNKEMIINEIKKYNIDPKKYIIISGAAMVLYGFKEETRDIDIATTKSLKKELLNKYNCEIENVECDSYMIDNIINFGTNYYKRRRNYIDGLPVQKVEDLIQLKKSLNREKDKNDLTSIYRKIG